MGVGKGEDREGKKGNKRKIWGSGDVLICNRSEPSANMVTKSSKAS